jgi:hypothetical protein
MDGYGSWARQPSRSGGQANLEVCFLLLLIIPLRFPAEARKGAMSLRLSGVVFFFLLLSISGCDSSSRTGMTAASRGPTGQLYVVNESANSILRFNAATAANGNMVPAANISGPATQLSSPHYIFLDVPNNRLYVANTGAGDVLVFDNISTLTANSPPPRVIRSPSLAAPADVALDPARNLLYVADVNEVAVFAGASAANGPTVAVRTIELGFTPGAILLDTANDRLFAADPVANAIDVFDGASVLNGPVIPIRSITGLSTQLSQPLGLRLDGTGRLIVSNAFPPSITIYSNAAIATGDVVPAAVISGGNTQLTTPAQLALDPNTRSGELYVADPFGAHVAVFSNINIAIGSINPAPSRNLVGPNTTLNTIAFATARGVALDTTR